MGLVDTQLGIVAFQIIPFVAFGGKEHRFARLKPFALFLNQEKRKRTTP